MSGERLGWQHSLNTEPGGHFRFVCTNDIDIHYFNDSQPTGRQRVECTLPAREIDVVVVSPTNSEAPSSPDPAVHRQDAQLPPDSTLREH